MEIMVVIIVIAVLASVAGPMIGSITDQGRASATKSKMSSLKSAMLAYQSDVGRLPFAGGNKRKASAYNAEKVLSYNDPDKNVLSSNYEITGVDNFGINNYQKKWKGPYMDSDPSDFMVDAWGNNIVYCAADKNVYLWSYGPDGEAYNSNVSVAFKGQTSAPDDCDDIVLSVARVKRSFDK